MVKQQFLTLYIIGSTPIIFEAFVFFSKDLLHFLYKVTRKHF
jgi:hypothetical protein